MADGFGAFVSTQGIDGLGIADRLAVRALFLSDLHLGTRDCQAARLLDLLERCDADHLYLVGDVVDGWRLKARWYWPRSHDAIVRCLLRKQHTGTRIRYIPGNHDEFLRHSIDPQFGGLQLGGIEVVNEALHEGLDGRRYLVVHGDTFDPVVRRMRRLSALGIWVYAASVLTSDAVRRWRRRLGRGRLGRSPADIAAFEHALTAEAKRQQAQGVICGHIHHPTIHDRLGVRYVNTGDWVDACTAVVEHHDGTFELLRWPFAAGTSAARATARQPDAVPGVTHVAALQHIIEAYGYAALLPLAIIEGPAVTVFAAFLAAQGLLDVAAVYAVVVVGDLLGDLIYYAAGRFLLQRLVDWRGRWAVRLRERVSELAPRIRARAGGMLLFGKLTHSAGFAVLLAAGAAHVPIRRFLLFNVLGTLPKSLVLVIIGYWFGRLYAMLQGDLTIAGLVGFVVASGVLALAARRMLAVPDESGA